MLIKLLLIAVFICTSIPSLLIANDTLYVNVDKSRIHWTGKKVTGEHSGTVDISSSFIVMERDSIIGGEFIIDMSTIKNTDIESPEWQRKLELHLMNEDFFYVDSFPFVILNIKNHQFIQSEESEKIDQIFAELTIRGITHAIQFPFQLSQQNSIFFAEGFFDINRTLFNIQYNSGTFFENLGDRMIYDDFTIQFSLQTKEIIGK